VGNTTPFVNVYRLLKVMETLKSWVGEAYVSFIISKLRRIKTEGGQRGDLEFGWDGRLFELRVSGLVI
jgi:hypothetical protein